MAKAALIDLVNAALITIGQEPIVSLDNNDTVSPTVVAVKAKVDIVKRKLLRLADWNCARITSKLVRVEIEDTLGWKYAYALPSNPECIRIVQISVDNAKTFIDLDKYYNWNSGPKESLFDIDGTYLLCNAEDVYIKYTGDIDVAKFDPSLSSAFTAQLAAELAYALPASVSLADYLMKLANKEIKSAKSLNARDRNILRPEGEVIGIRYGSPEGYLRIDRDDEPDERG